MAEAHRGSPYTVPPHVDDHDGNPPEYVMPEYGAYSVPDSVDSPERSPHGWDNSGYASTLGDTGGLPDQARLRKSPLRETRVGEGEPTSFYRRWFADFLGRHSVEYQDADGHEEQKGRKLVKARPVPSDTGEPRPTSVMAPNSYVFTRPYPGMGTAGHLTGVHFSMADHRREYPILGMAPVRSSRNTFRLEPEPWDTDVVDVPSPSDPSPDGRILAMDVAPSGNRSWRL